MDDNLRNRKLLREVGFWTKCVRRAIQIKVRNEVITQGSEVGKKVTVRTDEK
jgi:hypothetical protein